MTNNAEPSNEHARVELDLDPSAPTTLRRGLTRPTFRARRPHEESAPSAARVAPDLLRLSVVARSPHSEGPSPQSRSPHEPSLRLVRSGDAIFPDELYARLAPVVNKLLWTLLGPDSERDDVTHEIFLRILQGASKLRDPERLEAWAARVAVNAVKNEFRRRKLRRVLSLGYDDEQDSPEHHPDFEGRELLLRTYRVLHSLPTSERVPLTLRLVGQQSVEEIAENCGYSTRTVKRRLQAGRARFLRLASSDPLLAERLRQARFEEGSDG